MKSRFSLAVSDLALCLLLQNLDDCSNTTYADYLDDGTPVYRPEAMSAKLGVPEFEIQASVQAFMAARAALGLDTTPIDPALIHRRQLPTKTPGCLVS